jgi:hypothetical protein
VNDCCILLDAEVLMYLPNAVCTFIVCIDTEGGSEVIGSSSASLILWMPNFLLTSTFSEIAGYNHRTLLWRCSSFSQ